MIRNEDFIMDCHDHSISSETIRERFAAKHYGKVRPDYAKGWWAVAGRK